jgi:uncharacterized protein
MDAQHLPGSSNVVLEKDVPGQMRDGTTLYADVYRPASGGPFPVILMRLPYNKTDAETLNYHHPSSYARRGYMIVVQDTRGRGRSEGDFYPYAHEEEDGYDTVEWAASLPNSNGRVGMYGFFYAGATQLQAALGRPPSLKTICPALTGSQFYEGWSYNGGAFALAFNVSWATFLSMSEARRRGDDASTMTLTTATRDAGRTYPYLPLKDFPPLVPTGSAPFFLDWMAHPSYDDYWRRWSVDEDYSRIAVPALHIGGWYDSFVSGTLKNFIGLRREAGGERSRAAQKLLVGPWQHFPWARQTGVTDFGPEARNVVDTWQWRWFDQFLRDEDTNVLDSPVTIFLMGENRWMNESSWPIEGTEYQNYYLHSEGAANSLNGDGALNQELPGHEPPDIYIYDPLFPMPSLGGHSCCNPFTSPMGPSYQSVREMANEVLVYTSPPLEQSLTVIGPVSATLYAATSAVDTDFTVRLCDVTPDGRSINVQEGIIRARYRNSTDSPVQVTPHEIYEYRIHLGDTANVFGAGHRIRVQVTSSDFPQWDRNLNTGGVLGMEGAAQARVATQIILHEGDYASHITLPVMTH